MFYVESTHCEYAGHEHTADATEVIVHVAQTRTHQQLLTAPSKAHRHDMPALNQSKVTNGCVTGRTVCTSESILLPYN